MTASVVLSQMLLSFLLYVVSVVNSSWKSSLRAPEKVRVLCLHGYLGSAKLFEVQLRNLVEKTSPFADYRFIDAPFSLSLAEKLSPIPTSSSINDKEALLSPKKSSKFRWWRSIEPLSEGDGIRYDGIEESIRYLSDLERSEGPFHIILGHSQGAALVAAIDVLRDQPLMLNEILANVEEEETEESASVEKAATDGVLSDITLPGSDFSVLLSGFYPQDKVFQMLLRRHNRENRGLGFTQRSLHVFSELDKVLMPEASIQAMNYYRFPVMKVTQGNHEPPRGDDAEDFIANMVRNVWLSKHGPKIILEP